MLSVSLVKYDSKMFIVLDLLDDFIVELIELLGWVWHKVKFCYLVFDVFSGLSFSVHHLKVMF
jgi:hypothetical protein